MLQYRGEIALWALWGIIYPAVAYTMWSAAARGSADGSTIHGYAAADFAAYFLITMIVAHAAAAWDVFELGYLVRGGGLSPQLLRPMLPMWESLASNLAYKVVTLTILIPCWLIVAWFLQPRFQTDFSHLALGLLALIVGAALNYIAGYTLALISFWTTKVDAIGELWFGGSLIFGGRMAPLALMPGILQTVAWFLPFKWTFWFPVETLIGRGSIESVLVGIGMQLGWFIAAVLLFNLLWRAALRQYAAVGA